MIHPPYRAAFEHGRRVVLDRREREARAGYEAWERARRDYKPYVETAQSSSRTMSAAL
jgi:hypothetical protein